MVDFKVFRYCSSVAFLELMIACGLPFIKVLGHDISIFDFISMSAEIDVLAEQFGEYEEFIIKEIVSWRAICVTGITLIVIEAVLVLIIKTTKVLFVMASGMVINNLMGFIFVDNISNFLKYINESIVAIFIDDPLKLENNPIIIWLIIHGLIFAAMIAMLVKAMWSIKKENKRFEMDNIVFDEIKDKSKQEDFYGAIICESGHYRNKVFFMKKDEVISFGSEDSEEKLLLDFL